MEEHKGGRVKGVPSKYPRGTTFKDGKWWVRMTVHGREKWYRCANKSEARNLYDRLRAEVIEGRHDADKYAANKQAAPMLLDEYVKTWLENLPAKGKKRSTVDTYRGRLNKHILPAFGASPLPDITRRNIKAWAAGLLASLAYNTAFGCVLTLSAVLSEAVEDGLLIANPALRAGKIIKRPDTPNETADTEVAIFTPEEEQAFLSVVHKERPSFYPMALTFFRTGLRVGEVLGLHRAALDFTARTIHVRQQWSKGYLGTPKTENAKRKVDMSQGLATALTAWLELQDLEAAHAGRERPEIVFPGNIGGKRRQPFYMAENYLRYKLWFPLVKKAGIRRLDLHTARHTFASRLIANGENLQYIKEQMGHSSIKVTVDIYGHLIPNGNRAAVDRLDKLGVKLGVAGGSER